MLCYQCEAPATPFGTFHIVVGGYQHIKVNQHYLLDFGLSNSLIYFYRREHEDISIQQTNEFCGIKIQERLLLPNIGRDASAFFDYMIENYENPPVAFAFLHGHVGVSWHTSCNTTYSRILYYYRRIASGENPNRMMTLTANPKNNVSNPLEWYGRRQRGRKHRQLLTPKEAKEELKRKRFGPARYKAIDECKRLFIEYNITMRNTGKEYFESCCGTFILPGDRIRLYPKQFYYALRAFHMNPLYEDQHTGKVCFEFIVYEMFGDAYSDTRSRNAKSTNTSSNSKGQTSDIMPALTESTNTEASVTVEELLRLYHDADAVLEGTSGRNITQIRRCHIEAKEAGFRIE